MSAQGEKDYKEKLRDHFEERNYRPETVRVLGRMCRVGRLTEQTALDVLVALEEDRKATLAEAQGMCWADEAVTQFDETFYPGPLPGVIGSVLATPSLFEMTRVDL